VEFHSIELLSGDIHLPLGLRACGCIASHRVASRCTGMPGWVLTHAAGWSGHVPYVKLSVGGSTYT
jgi:hypothetical protein